MTLPSLDQLLHRPRHVLDRHVRVDAVLVEQVDAIGPEPLERGLGDLLDVLGRLSRPALPVCASMSKPNLVAITTWSRIGCERLADELFVRERAVDLGGVEEGDAALDGRADQRDRILLVAIGGP